MSVRNYNWYALQNTRRYPLDDRGTGVDNDGVIIRDDILVDCHVRFPSTVGAYAFVQGLTVAERLVTVVIGVSTAMDGGTVTTIAALTVPKPVNINVNYALTALIPGVAGWVVFGGGVGESFVGRYASPTQTLLAPRCARAYRPLPVPTIGKQYLDTALQGVISVVGQAPVTATQELVTIDGQQKPALVLRLEADTNQTTNPLQTFLGPCGERPESGTCPQPLISTINGVAPDCDGNIDIEFEGFSAYMFESCGGMDVIASLGLSEACNAETRRRRVTDRCNPEANSDSLFVAMGGAIPLPTGPDIFSSASLPDENYPESCATLPLCVSFTAGNEANTSFSTKEGLFVYEQLSARPAGCGAGAGNGYTYVAANVVGHSLSLYKNCASDWALGKTVTVQLRIGTSGLERNGGLVFNYLRGNPNTRTPTTYMVALLDMARAELRLLRYNGSSFVNEYATSFQVVPDKWYELSVSPASAGAGANVTVSAQSVDGSVPPTSFSVNIAQYGDPIGQAGFFADKSYTYFNSFAIRQGGL